jgi:hypothetical protein
LFVVVAVVVYDIAQAAISYDGKSQRNGEIIIER